jgi:outer membrane receptor for ferrienterochelin and colicin
MRYIVALVLLMQYSTSMLLAQQVVSGVVLEETPKGKFQPVSYANVYWEGSNIGTSTDTNGVFHIAQAEGSRKLITSFVGFQSDTLYVEDYSRQLSIRLKRSIALKTVEVEYRKKGTEMSFINPIQTYNMGERELFKAACCNLSESFETNPSVDVNFTDAVTGTRQIRMLGLSGPYTMISRENMPGVRGAGNALGLSFIPGTWINSIQVSKGVGSVVNGYESIAGQINVELQKPDQGEQTFLNLFGNMAGRAELNFVHTEQLSEKLGTTVLLHSNNRSFERDRNKDGFRDFPLQQQFNFMNRWKLNNTNGWMGQLGLHYINDERKGGQSDSKREALKQQNKEAYTLDIETEKVELFGKVGYLFPEFKYKSIGFQWSLQQHEQSSLFGRRNYDIRQQSAYANLIYQSIIANSFHQFKTGISLVYDDYREQLDSLSFNRVERVPGVFWEYTYKPSNNFTAVAGIRADHHNLYGSFFTPRVHLRYALNETTVLRGLAGSGQRSPMLLIDRQSLLATSRNFEFLGNKTGVPYGIEMEKAWNFGLNLTKDFSLSYRDGSISLDVYHSRFEQQLVADLDESSQRVLFYNLEGKSFANTAQVQIDYELLKFLDLRVAYRWVQAKTDYKSGLRQQPLVPENRFFVNLAYETQTNLDNANWTFDATMQWQGEQRIPYTLNNPREDQRATYSPSFATLNMQVTRNFNKRWSLYAGVENIFNYQQDNPIIAADNPFGNNFDASLIWGPIFGRNIYGGLRWRIKKEG